MNVSQISISRDELRVMLETGYILREAARFDDAEAVFRGVIEFLPQSDVPRVGLGTVFLQRGDFAAAEEICLNALNLNPDSVYARLHYAEALLFGKRRDQAEDELREIIGNHPDSPHSETARALLEAADLIAPH
ncbi:MAG: tetratricopeptide repeat protein [Acidobacteria bacterium]|nr:tetratricopeptide repeat protein [Acidobacteriota bacterium]